MTTDYDHAAVDRAKAHDAFRLTSLYGGPLHGGRYAEAEAGTGSRYAAFASPLPGDVEGGSLGTHVLVTLYSPRQAAWVFARYPDDTTIPRYYIAEHLAFPAGLGHAGDVEAVCLLVGRLLDLEVV